MENKALKIIAFIIVTGIALFLLGISIFIMDKQPYTYIDNSFDGGIYELVNNSDDIHALIDNFFSGDIYALLGIILLLLMPILTFIMRSLSNISYAWILGIILVVASSAILAIFTNSYYFVLAALYIICCLGIFVPAVGGGGGGGCNKYCDCCVGECY